MNLRVAAAGSLIAATLAVGCQPVANMPVELRDEIAAAAHTLTETLDDQPPAAYSFRDVHCRADGHVLIVFEQLGGITEGATATATSTDNLYLGPWAYNHDVDDLGGDLARFFTESPSIACPPAPG